MLLSVPITERESLSRTILDNGVSETEDRMQLDLVQEEEEEEEEEEEGGGANP
jgi:hypothetical protein